MELMIIGVIVAVVAIFAVALSRELTDGFEAWTQWIIDHLVNRAVRRFAEEERSRFEEECRVGEDVATLTPHRPGRADFPHPVLHERGSLTAAYPWRILTEGSGWRARSALKRAHGTPPPRCRRDNHLRQTRTT